MIRVIEKEQRLKNSLLWALQEKAYTQFGPEAWAKKGVPFYLTSNPLIAKQFADTIAGWIRDCQRKAAATPIDPSKPIYIFDLGAGSGRLAYLVLKELLPLFHEKLLLKYVMTDMVQENLSFWEQHPLLKPYLEQGVLDYALYHHASQEPLRLVRSDLRLENTPNPSALICTYFFDTLPQDLFRFGMEGLEEGRISLSVATESQENLDLKWIMDLEADYSYFPIAHPNAYYPDPGFSALLMESSQLYGKNPFLFPIGGLEALDYFARLSSNRFLLLAGDQGVATVEQVCKVEEPKISRHASFSISVNYHILARYFEEKGGVAFLPSFPNPQFVILGGILGGREEFFKETQSIFFDQIDFFSSVDYWALTNLSLEIIHTFSLNQLLILIKLGNYDPVNLNVFFEPIRKKLSSAEEETKRSACMIFQKCWEHFFPIDPSEGNFVINLGVLFFECKQYREALVFFEKAAAIKGEIDATLLRNQALCHKVLGDTTKAAALLRQARELG